MTWFKLFFVGCMAVASMYALAADAAGKSVDYYVVGGRGPVSKVDAVRSMISDESSEVYRCVQVELTEKLTLRNKRGVKNK